MRYAEATDTFSEARFPERGKPLRGKETRLFERDGDFILSYRDTEIVTIHPDGTYTLSDGGYPTITTAKKISEYAPVQVSARYKRNYLGYGWPRYEIEYEDLEMGFEIGPTSEDLRSNLMILFNPDLAKRRALLRFPRGTIRVDEDGRPLVSDLLSRIAPPEWSTRLAGRLQAWSPEVLDLPWSEESLQPYAVVPLELRKWAGAPRTTPPLLVRRSFVGNRAMSIVWEEGGILGQPRRFRWMVLSNPAVGPQRPVFGLSPVFDLAVSDAGGAAVQLGWSKDLPVLLEVLGGLAPGPARGDLDRRVLRVHWMEPWESRRPTPTGGSEIYPRGPLPGSRRWTGPPGYGDVRVWFELDGGRGVAVASDGRETWTLATDLRGRSVTGWEVEGVLPAGSVPDVLAYLARRGR